MVRRYLLWAFLMPLSYLSATTFFEIDTTIPLKCHFSIEHHNRILVDKGRVKKVVYPEESLCIHLEEHSGQAFISATKQISKPLTLAIITESGLVQDIEIEFKEKPSSVVVLKEPKSIPPDEEPICEPMYANQEKQVINSKNCIEELLIGRIPTGYVSCPAPIKSKDIKRSIRAKTLVKLESAQDNLYLYEITNRSNRSRALFERELECKGCKWVFLETNRLEPKEKILGVICVGHP